MRQNSASTQPTCAVLHPTIASTCKLPKKDSSVFAIRSTRCASMTSTVTSLPMTVSKLRMPPPVRTTPGSPMRSATVRTALHVREAPFKKTQKAFGHCPYSFCTPPPHSNGHSGALFSSAAIDAIGHPGKRLDPPPPFTGNAQMPFTLFSLGLP